MFISSNAIGQFRQNIFFSILRAYVKCEPPSSTTNTVKVLDRILNEDIISQFFSFFSQFTAPFITALGSSTK